MATDARIEQYKEQIQSVAMYCKRIGYNHEKDDFISMMRGWLQDNRRTNNFIDDHREDVTRILKKLATTINH